MIRRLLRIAVAMGVLLAMLLVAACAGAASPRVLFTIPHNHVTADHAFVVSYKALDAPAGIVLDLQEQESAAHIWLSIGKLKGTSGSFRAPGEPIGQWIYRVVAVKDAHVLAVSLGRALYSYGAVSMATICEERCTGSGTEVVGTHVFTYVVSNRGSNSESFSDRSHTSTTDDRYPAFTGFYHANTTSCRSAVLDFASATPKGDTGDSRAEVLQSTTNPEVASVGPNKIGILHATFDGGPWYLEGSDALGFVLLLNGTWSCYTSSGFLP